jgi:hypothetical protein
VVANVIKSLVRVHYKLFIFLNSSLKEKETGDTKNDGSRNVSVPRQGFDYSIRPYIIALYVDTFFIPVGNAVD